MMMTIFSVPLQTLLEANGNIIIDNWLLYHKWDVVWSCLACVALTDVMLVALFIATCRGGIRIRSLMRSFFIIWYSRHMWFFEKNISRSNVRAVWVQPISFLFRKNEQFSSISRNAKCRFRFYSIAAIKRFSSEFRSVALKFFPVFLDYTPGIELINRDTRQKREYHFQWGQLCVST